MNLRPRHSLSWLAIALSSCAGIAAHAQPDARLLWPDPDRFAQGPVCNEGLVIAGADITSVRNGTGLDGAMHFAGLFGLDFAVNAGNDASGTRAAGGRVHAPSGRVSLTEIDLSFPSAGPGWTIGRSYASGVQDANGARVSPGYQGNNWFASAQPVLSPCTNGSGQVDKLALVYGADREVRFARVVDGPAAGVFRATDGAAGVIVPVLDNSIQYYEYHDASGNVARFMGVTPTSAAPAWHLVSITDAAGASAHVQYAAGLPSIATDSAGRTFTYSYDASSGSTRLVSVVVHAATGPEVGRVEYTYAGANDARGLPGDLVSVRTRVPVSDQSHTIDRTWHYRYHTTAIDAGRLSAKIDPEGVKRAIEAQIDPTLVPAAYRDSAFTYDASGRVWTANVREKPNATLRLTYAVRNDVGGYDPTWHRATTIHTDTGGCNDLWETLYFDEAEQPLGAFAFDANPTLGSYVGQSGSGAKVLTASWQERNADGVVVRLRDGANLHQYVHHAPNGIVFVPDSLLGLVVDRALITSGMYQGFEAQVSRRVGDAASSGATVSSTTYVDLDDGAGGERIAGYLVASPLIESVTRFPAANAAGDTTTHSYTFHDESGLALKTVTVTDPVVSLAQNGDGATNSVSHYYDLAGRKRFERSRSGRIHVWDYDASTGQLSRFVWDAAASQVVGALPTGFAVTGPASELMRREWKYGYDLQGRLERRTAPDGRVSLTRVSTLADGRPLVYSVPRADGLSGQSPSFVGPVSFTKLDLEGSTLESVHIGPKVTRVASASGFNVTLTTARSADEPRSWLAAGATTLADGVAAGFERANLVTRQFDSSATFLEQTRVYTRLSEVSASPTPLVPRVISVAPYDLTRYGYDCTGRAKWTRKPDGSVYTAVRDPLGRTTEVWRGFADGEQDPAAPTQAFKLATMVYDQGESALLNRLTTLTLHPGGNESDRVTRLYYDAQGDVVAIKSPVAPHAVLHRDMLGRVTRESLFGGDGAFLDAPGFDPTLDRVADRQLVNDTFYDPLGRVYRSTRYAIDPDGSSVSGRTTPTDYFFGKEGSLRLLSGSVVKEFGYNRACEVCTIRTLTTSANGIQIPSVQAFLNSVNVLEDTRLLRDRATGWLIGEINAIRDVGRSPYDADRTLAGAPGVLIQESSIQWDTDGATFSFTPPAIYTSGPGYDYRFNYRTRQYDAVGRAITTIDYGDPRLVGSYAAINGGLLSEIDAAAQALTLLAGTDTDDAPRASLIAYDGLGRAIAAIGPDATASSFQYDALGRTVSQLGGTLGGGSSPGSNGPNGPEVGMLVIDSCPTEGGNEYGYDRGKIIWQRAIVPGDPNYPEDIRTPEEHWLYGEDDPSTYPSGILPFTSPPNIPPTPREPAIYRALVDEIPAAWQDLELLSDSFREATGFNYNALGQPIAISTTGGTGFSIQRDPGGRPIAMDPAFDTSINANLPTPILDIAGSLAVRWEYDSLGRLRRVYQVQPGTTTPILDIQNTFGNLGELLSHTTTANAPDPTWTGIGPIPTAQTTHFYQFPEASEQGALRRLRLIGSEFPGGLGMKIDFDSSPDDQRIGRPRRAYHGIWMDNQFTPPTVAGQPIDAQLWRGGYHGVWRPAWDELPSHPLLNELRTVRDYGPALGMAIIGGFPDDPGSNRFGELTRDWIHQPICNGISCTYPGSAADPLSTPFGNDDTISRGRDGTSRTTISDVPNSRDLTYQPLTCTTPNNQTNQLVGDLFQGPLGTLVVRRGSLTTPSQADPLRIEHLVRDASGGLLKHVVEQDIGQGREVLSVYEAVFSSSNRLVAYATKTPPENTTWDEMPSPLDPIADEAIIVRPEYDLRGNLIQDTDNQGRPRRFTYDAFNRLTAVYIDRGEVVNNVHVSDWRILSKHRYDALGRRVATIHNRNDTTTLNDDFVEFYGYDQSWRLTTVWRQSAADENGSGGRPAPVIYERFLHNPGWGSRLDAPLMSQVNDNWDQADENGDPVEPIWDGPDSRRRTFIQDAFGNVIAVRDDGLERPIVRISYSPTGEPILDSYYSGADFDRNGGIDGGDLAAFFAAFEEGHESADIDQNGGVEGGDLALFLAWHEAGFAGDHTLDAQRFLYRGYHWDDALKMYHVRHRVYDPARMLWIQRDPLGRIPGANEYAYCLGEPIDFYDPMGLWGEQTATRMVNSEWAAERALGWVVGTVGGAAEQVASSVEAMANATPESIAEGIAGTVEQGIKREDKYAEHGGYDPSLVDYALTIAAEFVGANEAAAGIAGVDVLEDRLITDNWERFERAGTGLAQMFETGAGLAGGAVGGLRSVGTTSTRRAAGSQATMECTQAGVYSANASARVGSGGTATKGGIGATGKIGEDALKVLGGESQVYFKTSQGARYVDQLVNGIAHESKVGYQTLTATTRRQIVKDTELLRTGQIQDATWHFFRSPVTGLVGPSQPLMNMLQRNRINVIIHP